MILATELTKIHGNRLKIASLRAFLWVLWLKSVIMDVGNSMGLNSCHIASEED